MTSKPYLQVNWKQICESRLLSPERIAFLEAECAWRIQPLLFKDKEVSNARVVQYPDRYEMVTVEGQNGYYLLDYHKKNLIAELLTPEEFTLLNKEASSASWRERERQLFEKADKISDLDWRGGVFWGDDFYASLDDALEMGVADEIYCESDIPEFIWAAKEECVIPDMDVNQILERYTENINSDAEIEFKGMTALQAALDTFVKANEGNTLFWSDYTKAIKISDETKAELITTLGFEKDEH